MSTPLRPNVRTSGALGGAVLMGCPRRRPATGAWAGSGGDLSPATWRGDDEDVKQRRRPPSIVCPDIESLRRSGGPAAMLGAMTVASGPVELAIDLDRSSPVPLYHQLAVALERAITDGRLRPGDRLENELAMTTRLGLARPTARQAIQELVRKGLLVRKRGVGTQVVAAAPIRRDVKFS